MTGFQGSGLRNEVTGFQRTSRDETRYMLVLCRSRMENTDGNYWALYMWGQHAWIIGRMIERKTIESGRT